MKLQIKNGRVIDPANHLDQHHDVFIDNGKIVAITDHLADFTADKTIDATGMIVCPGLIDISARLGEQSYLQTADIDRETKAAVRGGITTLCVPPDTDPVIDTPAVIELIEDRAKKAGRVMVHTIGALTQQLNSELLSEMLALKQAGCLGVSNALKPIQNTLILRRAMEYAATLDLTLFINPSDPWLQSQGCVHEGMVSSRLGLGGIPEAAETIALARDLMLIEQAGVSAHFHSISSGKAVAMLKEAQDRGVKVTADVSAHHLHLSEHDIGNYDSLSHVLPPLRSTRDREQLQQGVREGVLTAVSSHHQPLSLDAKLGPFAETSPGISGLETLLPLLLKLVDDDELTLHQAIACLTNQPAEILGIDAGKLNVGSPADLCIFQSNVENECQPQNFTSSGKNSPFAGWLFNNQVAYTLFEGSIVFAQDRTS